MPKAATKIDANSFLIGNVTTSKPGAKKKDHPEVDSAKGLADATYHAYKAVKDAEAAFAACEGQLLEIVRPEYEGHAKAGNFAKTFNVAGDETPGVQVSYKDMFKKVPLERESELRERLGDKFDNFYYQKRDLSLKDTSDEVVTLLLQKLGEDTFRNIFKIEISIACKPDMDRKQWELAEDCRPEQYKAALKIRTE